MRHPHPVPVFDGWADILAMDVPMRLCETGVPQSDMLGVLSGEIRYLLDRMAETGRTDHRAIGAGQTSYRHIVPSRMLMGVIERLW